MIVNYKEEGWEVITQRSHGILAAQWAAQWKWKVQPARWMELILAIAEHDDAENELDGENLLTPTGGPLNFDMKNFDLQLCTQLSTLTLTKSRYIALLTSMHMVFLYSKDEATDPAAKTFLDEQRTWQARWRKELHLTKEEAQQAYSLLEWCDALSLLLCTEDLQPENRRLEISTGPDGKSYSLVQLDENTLTISPWPFRDDTFRVCFEKRVIPQLQFSSSGEFREAFVAAKVEEKVWMVKKQKTRKPSSKKV